MCGGYTGEYDNMNRTAEIVNIDGIGYIVHLLEDGNAFGKIYVRDKSVHYAQDVAENWENGILGKDNEYIKKFEKSS